MVALAEQQDLIRRAIVEATDLGVMDVTPEGLKLVELADGVTREFIQSKTGVPLI